LKTLGFDAASLIGAKGFTKTGLLADAVNAIYTSRETKQRFECLEGPAVSHSSEHATYLLRWIEFGPIGRQLDNAVSNPMPWPRSPVSARFGLPYKGK
jgi:hypothetical protein